MTTRMPRTARLLAGVAALLITLPVVASAAERLCDPAFEDCRKPLLALINNETKAIDVAFWFMTDTKYSDAIIARWKAGVPVRVLIDTEANVEHPENASILSQLKSAGIPMREKTTGGILHWKTMLFLGQNTVEFSGANYSPVAFAFGTPYADYEDEIIFFSDTPSIVNSFKTSYDDKWVSTSGYANYANIKTTLVRKYPTYPKDPELNFPPAENYRTRALNAYKYETVGIDVSMFRITDRTHADAMIAAVKRGVPVRLITEQEEYRNPDRLWDSYNVDRMYAAGVQVKIRGHEGLSHEKLVLLDSQAMAIFGSSNWTSPSAASQAEHNLFTTDTTRVAWLRDHWDRKWFNSGPSPETTTFKPLPPDTPTLKSPAEGATGVSTGPTLKWYAGKWAHKYDVYIGTSTTSMTRVLTDTELGPSETSTDYQSFAVSGLKAGTKYYWKVIARTMANLAKTSATGSFTTGSSSTTGPLPTGWLNRDIGSVSAAGSAGYSSGVFTVKGSGADIWGSADEFQFVYKTLTGDGSIVARVTSVQNVNAWTKAGVMMRETLSAGARNALMLVSPGKGLAFQRRTATGGATTSTIVAGAAPSWVKVTRTGGTFSAYVSSDGATWKLVGSQSMTMPSTIYVGLAVGSHADGTVATAKFDNVK